MTYDELLIVSFGGPERREDVIPPLENVLRGKRVPRERMMEWPSTTTTSEARAPYKTRTGL